MKRTVVLLAVVFLASSSLVAQTGGQSSSSASASARADAKAESQAKPQQGEITLDAGSQIQAETTSSLDLKKAKPGDKFKMKTTRPVKRDGKEVISRGSTITGHIEQVTRADNTTTATLMFDEIMDKKTGTVASLDAVVTAVTKAQSNMSSMASDDMMPPPPPRRQQGGQQQSGGLLGGVANTVGGVTGQVGATVDSTTRGTVGADAGVTKTTGGLVGGTIQIVNDTTASATSGSTLSVADRNAKIENGTQFILQTTSALTLTGRRKEKEKSN